MNEKLVPQPAVVTTYTVQSGDALWSIARMYNTTWATIAALNNLSNPNLIYPDQVLKVPGSAGPATPAPTSGFHVGDIVVPTVLRDVHGNSLKQWDNAYTITAISGTNATLSARGQVWAVLPVSNIKKAGSSSSSATAPAAAPTSQIHVGDTVRVTNAVTYGGQSFKTWYDTYQVMELKGDRAVIGVNGQVTAAISIHNITKA